MWVGNLACGLTAPILYLLKQKCAYQEVDDIDSQAYHLWFEDDEGIEAYLRLIPAGVARQEVSLGRVIAVKRRCGLGTKIVAQGIRIAQEKLHAKEIVIEAQTYVRKMYESLGFVAESEEFLEDGIPHVRMRLKF